MIRYIEGKLGGKAKIALLEFLSQAPEQATERIRGFKSALLGMTGLAIVAAGKREALAVALEFAPGVSEQHVAQAERAIVELERTELAVLAAVGRRRRQVQRAHPR